MQMYALLEAARRTSMFFFLIVVGESCVRSIHLVWKKGVENIEISCAYGIWMSSTLMSLFLWQTGLLLQPDMGFHEAEAFEAKA